MKKDKEMEVNGEIEPVVEVVEEVEDSEAEDCVEESEAQISELMDRLQRTMADFDNYRKRTQRERANMQADGVRDVIEKLLPVLDNFERAMQAPNVPKDNFYKGVQMILRQFMSTLEEIGILEIPALDESFNPEMHFAVSHIDDEKYGDNMVIEVLQKGYKYKEKVIRPSMVRVAN